MICIHVSMHNLIKIYHVVQESWAFSLTGHGRTDSHSDYSAHLRVVQFSSMTQNESQRKDTVTLNTWHFIIAPLWKSGDYTGFALSFRYSVIPYSVFPSLFHFRSISWEPMNRIKPNLYAHYHWWDLCWNCKSSFFSNLQQSYGPWLMSEFRFAQYLDKEWKELNQIAQPAVVHYNRGVSRLKPVSEQLAKTLITLEPHGIFW